MKILQVNPYPPEHFGGSEIFCKNLANNLSKYHEIESDILTSDYFRKNRRNLLLNKHVNVIYKRLYINLWNKNPIVNIYPYLRKNYQKYDIIHAHSYIFFTSFQCALMRRFRKFPFLLHLHGGIQTQTHVHSNLSELIQLIMKKNLFDKSLGKFTIQRADGIISVSEKDLNIIQKQYTISHKNCYHVPNGVDTEIFKPEETQEKKYITFIGRLTYIKGFDIFIKMIKKIHKFNNTLEFLVIGDGPLKKLMDQVGNSISLTHFVRYPYNLMKKIYNQSKVLILTSRFEGVPTTILESLSCGTPVISTNVGGISEIIQDGINGILLPNRLNSLNISSIMDLIEDEKKLKQYGKKGRQLILEHFSWKKITNQILKIYDQLI
ncbi:MAG: glycosyltransferase family 4 protein [Promethearchaeota archaeon]